MWWQIKQPLGFRILETNFKRSRLQTWDILAPGYLLTFKHLSVGLIHLYSPLNGELSTPSFQFIYYIPLPSLCPIVKMFCFFLRHESTIFLSFWLLNKPLSFHQHLSLDYSTGFWVAGSRTWVQYHSYLNSLFEQCSHEEKSSQAISFQMHSFLRRLMPFYPEAPLVFP